MISPTHLLLAAAMTGIGSGAQAQEWDTHIDPNPTYAQMAQGTPSADPNCVPTPTYRLKGNGLEPVATQCADRPGEGKLEALSPRSWMTPAMIIEVSPSTTIFVPQRQPGIRVWRVGTTP